MPVSIKEGAKAVMPELGMLGGKKSNMRIKKKKEVAKEAKQKDMQKDMLSRPGKSGIREY